MNLTYPTIKQLDAMGSLKALPAAYYQSGKPSAPPDNRVDRTAKPRVMAERLLMLPPEFDVKIASDAWKLQTVKSAHSRLNILKAEGLVEPTGIKIENYMQYRKTQLASSYEKQFGGEDE